MLHKCGTYLNHVTIVKFLLEFPVRRVECSPGGGQHLLPELLVLALLRWRVVTNLVRLTDIKRCNEAYKYEVADIGLCEVLQLFYCKVQFRFRTL